MTEKVKIDEDLLIRYSKDISIDPELPFRLQKSQLFKKLGFPIKKTVPIPVNRKTKIRAVFAKFMKENLPFLIVTSPKPMLTCVPPLFKVNTEDIILYRDVYKNIESISSREIFLKIEELPQKSWIEFTENIWGGNTIAGRLLYASAEEQVLEIQKGVEIPDLGNDRMISPYFSMTLSFFEHNNSNNYRKTMSLSGFKRTDVQKIIDSLRECARGFESLRKIGRFPALEFGYTNKKGLQVIDVDWPRQWIY